MPKDNIIKFPTKTERKTIIINGKKYDTLYIELKSMLPDVDLDYMGYYDFDLVEHGVLCGFLFVEKVIDYTIGASYRNVLFDPVGNIIGFDVPIDALKATALRSLAKN